MPVSDADLTTLAASYDIIGLGMRADDARRRLHGSDTTYVRVAEVTAEPAGAISLSPAAGEFRIVGAPAGCGGAVDRVREVLQQARGVPVSAFSLADLEELAPREGLTLRALLEELRGAGLELIAEAPFDRLRDARRSIEEVNIAGLSLARLTVHQSPSSEVPTLLRRVADLQHSVAVIRAFAPLPRKLNSAAPTTGFDDVKRVALARLIVENVPSIQVDWALYGPKLAQVALTMGADDVDSVSPEDDMSKGQRRSPVEEIQRNIRAAGQRPVERNGRFDSLAR